MLVESGVDLVVEVVEERGRAPEVLVLAELPRVGADRGLDGEGVAQERLALRVLGEGRPGAFASHVHGTASIARSPWPTRLPLIL